MTWMTCAAYGEADRGHGVSAGQDRGGGHRQDGDQRVAAATGSPGVGDGGQVGEQVRVHHAACAGWTPDRW